MLIPLCPPASHLKQEVDEPFFLLTCVSWAAGAPVRAHLVHAGGPVATRLGRTLIHLQLAEPALVTRHAETRVAVTTATADGTVVARVGRAGVVRPIGWHT